jgi:hypothetical protein
MRSGSRPARIDERDHLHVRTCPSNSATPSTIPGLIPPRQRPVKSCVARPLTGDGPCVASGHRQDAIAPVGSPTNGAPASAAGTSPSRLYPARAGRPRPYRLVPVGRGLASGPGWCRTVRKFTNGHYRGRTRRTSCGGACATCASGGRQRDRPAVCIRRGGRELFRPGARRLSCRRSSGCSRWWLGGRPVRVGRGVARLSARNPGGPGVPAGHESCRTGTPGPC